MDSVTLLLIEDDPILAMDLARRLTKLGYHVLGAVDTDGKALDIYRNHHIDLTLLTIGLPGAWTGIDIATELQKIRQSPFIFLTELSEGFTIERARKLSPSGYIARPFDDFTLRMAISLAIHHPLPPSDLRSQLLDEPAPTALADPGELLLNLNEVVFIKQKYRFVKFRLSDVLYMQSDGNYTDIFTIDQKYTVRLVLNKVLEKLQSATIIRHHRSFAVNIRHVNSFSEQEVRVGPHSLPVGRSYRDVFVKRFSLL